MASSRLLFNLPGWKFWTDTDGTHTFMHVEMATPLLDNRSSNHRLFGFGDSFIIQPDWTDQQLIERVFVQLQYLIDHELREQFTVNGIRVFESHDPPITGFQKEWFVEHASALRGY